MQRKDGLILVFYSQAVKFMASIQQLAHLLKYGL